MFLNIHSIEIIKKFSEKHNLNKNELFEIKLIFFGKYDFF